MKYFARKANEAQYHQHFLTLLLLFVILFSTSFVKQWEHTTELCYSLGMCKLEMKWPFKDEGKKVSGNGIVISVDHVLKARKSAFQGKVNEAEEAMKSTL